jgi:hypothetical protein
MIFLLLPLPLQDWLQMQAKSEEAAVRREVNKGTADLNKQLSDERRLAELQKKVCTISVIHVQFNFIVCIGMCALYVGEFECG